jgi:hypothetical protein
MTVVINKGESKILIDRKLARLNKLKRKAEGFPANRFLGKLKIEGDPVKIQRIMRDE